MDLGATDPAFLEEVPGGCPRPPLSTPPAPDELPALGSPEPPESSRPEVGEFGPPKTDDFEITLTTLDNGKDVFFNSLMVRDGSQGNLRGFKPVHIVPCVGAVVLEVAVFVVDYTELRVFPEITVSYSMIC